MSASTPKVWLTTLGCAKNQVDSDKVTGVLHAAGYEDAASPEAADVVMVNTCAFIEPARRESIDTVLELAEAKQPAAKLVVLGCMAQRYEQVLIEALPEADAVIGLDRYPELVGRLDQLTEWQPLQIRPLQQSAMDILYETLRPTPSTPYAYVKVAEGCDKLCTFCAIPQFRGKQRSRSKENIVAEVTGLVRSGVREIVLVAQDLAAYGRDVGDRGGLRALVEEVAAIPGLRWLRLYYLYPGEIRQPLIDAMAEMPKIANYFDLSLQHSSHRLLRAMKRPGSGHGHMELIHSIRKAAPDAALRSSFIVGFPGETEDDVESLAAFLRSAQLDWVGLFPFSPEEGTPAAELSDQVPHDAAMERLRYLQGLQDDITHAKNAAEVGRSVEVLVDQVEEGQAVGRSYRQAPEIDGVVLLDRGAPGEWLQAEIVGAYGTDLEARVLR
ncbi:MAG: 30S ribosomal protein S12 methylthiotransferase RimO [Acidimicrobiia bacterium]|nr:30S ribosomal protein S12 methylthiotransferase RimO [Acidimicrobiia bacterium]